MSAFAEQSTVEQVEAAVVAQLKTGFDGLGVSVESYGGQLDDEMFAWLRTLPAVWVTFDRHTSVEAVGADRWKFSARFVVMAAARVLGPEPQRRLGNGVDVGVYQLLHQAMFTLTNEQCGLPIAPFNPGAAMPVMKGRPKGGDAVAVYSQYFTTWWVEKFDKDPNAPLLDGVNLNYFLNPTGTVPDASDEVSLGA